MTDRTRLLLEEVLALPADERSALIEQVLATLEAQDDGVTWTPELERRAREALRGENLRDAADVFADLRAELRARG